MRLRFDCNAAQWVVATVTGVLAGGMLYGMYLLWRLDSTLASLPPVPPAGEVAAFVSLPGITPLPTVSPTPSLTPTPAAPATLDDFWEGRAVWQMDVYDVGLPPGESDTLVGPDGQLWSYLHASFQSAGIVDAWGAPVPFPGCVTLWKSADRGRQFQLAAPQCLIACQGWPCTPETDQIDQQQYPRVARADNGAYVMVYEWGGATYLRVSPDGLNWSDAAHVPGTGQRYRQFGACSALESIGPHPYVASEEEYDCLRGGPPGVYLDQDQLYVFVGLGKNPGHMGCLSGPLAAGAAGLRVCASNPLFTGTPGYGPLEATGLDGNPYFDFRTVSAADVLNVGERYYMVYEGVRGPRVLGHGDAQFNLGFARSPGPQIDGPWDKYPGNPVLLDVPGNIGVGHADLLVLDGATYLYTATSGATRGRYVLAWK